MEDMLKRVLSANMIKRSLVTPIRPYSNQEYDDERILPT